MNLEGMRVAQSSIEDIALAELMMVSEFVQTRKLGASGWNRYLEETYSIVDDARRRSSELGRQYYDDKRFEAGVSGRLDIDLVPFPKRYLDATLLDLRGLFVQADTPPGAAVQAVGRMQMLIRNGNRETVLSAVAQDKKAIGWARVDEIDPCAFCLMLISNGLYRKSRQTPNVNPTDSVDEFLVGAERGLYTLAPVFHPWCNCLVVPAFNLAWDGKSGLPVAKALFRRLAKGDKGRAALNRVRRALEESA